MSITITFTDEEALAVEAQLKQIEEDHDDYTELIPCVQKELDRLEGARIRFSQAIQETYS